MTIKPRRLLNNNHVSASALYNPQPSEEAKICMTCTEKRCKGNACQRYREEKKKIKERNNDRV